MDSKQERYCEVAIGSVTNRGRIIPVEDLAKILKENQNIELYRSYYTFDKEILEHFQKYKSVRTFKGMLYLEKIIFDIDKGSNTDTFTLQRVREFYNRLKDDFEVGKDHIRIYFSGRGYHIVIPNIFNFKPSPVMHYHVKETLEKYFPEADSIYDNTRIIRVVNSKNLKSGLYKVPLTPDELFSLDAEGIMKLALKPRTINGYYKQFEATALPDLNNLVEYDKIELKTSEGKPAQETNYVTCVQNMITEGPSEGTRHHKLLRISDAWRKTGIPRQVAFTALKEWANNMEPHEVQHVVENVYDSPTINYGCNDRLRIKYCDSKCIFYRTRNNAVDVVASDIAEAYYHKQMFNAQSGFNLKDIFPGMKYNYWFNKGELSILIGDTKLGKSTIIQNIITKLTDKKVIYLSLEMSLKLTFRRFIQIAHNLTKADVDNHYKKSKSGLASAIDHVKIIVTAPNLEDLRKMIADHAPDIVVVDTLDCLQVTGFNEENSKIGMIANGLRMLAQSMNVGIIGVHHISKSASQDEKGYSKAMTVHSGKGSSAVEQKADRVLSFEGNRDMSTRVFKTLADRDQMPMQMLINFNKDTLRMEMLNE